MLATLELLMLLMVPLVEFLKDKLKLSGWKTVLANFILSTLVAGGYGIQQGMIWYYIVILILALWGSSCGLYKIIKKIAMWIGGIEKVK